MRSLWLVAIGLVLLEIATAGAQPPQSPRSSSLITSISAASPQQPQLPPLLTPPPPAREPLAEVPRPGGPAGEYDHGYMYLPDSLPQRGPPEACRPLGRWWVDVSLELTWAPTRPARATVRLPAQGAESGLRVPLAGQSSGQFGGGFGLTVGRWFDEQNTHGLEGSFFFRVADRTFDGFAPGSVVILADGPGRSPPRVLVFPTPNVVGYFPVTLTNFFTAVDANYRFNLLCAQHARLDALAGYRFAYVSDELYLGEVPDGGDDYRRNRVLVSNPFHGGQVGLAGELRANGWYVSSSAKIAFGVVTPDVTTSGLFVGAEARRGRNGFARLAALSSDDESRFAVLPAFNVSLGRQLTDHARVFAGYTFYYLSRAARLGDALDPGNSELKLTDFWVNSVSLGFELRY